MKMKILYPLLLIAISLTVADGQWRTISKSEYDGPFNQAEQQSFAAFPHIVTITQQRFENDKLMSTETQVLQDQGNGFQRKTQTLVSDGKTTNKYQINLGYSYIYCSDDGVKWKWGAGGEWGCWGPSMSYGARDPVISNYSVSDQMLNGEAVKVYRYNTVFVYPYRDPKNNKEFNETVTTIDSRGFLISMVETEGTPKPRVVNLVRKLTWSIGDKFPPVELPK